MTDLNEKALEAAASAIDTSWSEDGTNRDYPFPETEKSYQDHCRVTAQAAIRAYLEAATPPDVAGLLERLNNAATDWRDLKDSENADLLTEAATALRLSAGGGGNGWISVSDRLPGEQGQDSENVLCFLNGHCDLHDMDCRKGGGWGVRIGFYDGEKQCFRAGGIAREVTHWQPLPLPPASPTVEAGHVE
jgi:hypothetical protein